MSKAITLLELLVVVAIVSLMAALLFPALSGAVHAGKSTVCTSNLRQLGVGVLLYREDHEGWPRSSTMDTLIDQGYVRDSRLFVCPDDRLRGIAGLHMACMMRPSKYADSYYWPFDPQPALWNELKRVDESPAIVACRAHGDWKIHPLESGNMACDLVPYAIEGKLLRVREDGSVAIASMNLAPSKSQGSARTFRRYRLFSDKVTQWD